MSRAVGVSPRLTKTRDSDSLMQLNPALCGRRCVPTLYWLSWQGLSGVRDVQRSRRATALLAPSVRPTVLGPCATPLCPSTVHRVG